MKYIDPFNVLDIGAYFIPNYVKDLSKKLKISTRKKFIRLVNSEVLIINLIRNISDHDTY